MSSASPLRRQNATAGVLPEPKRAKLDAPPARPRTPGPPPFVPIETARSELARAEQAQVAQLRDAEAKKAAAEAKKTEAEAKVAELEAKLAQAEAEAQPQDEADGEAEPADGEAEPADGEAKPADGEAKPADGEAEPADGEIKVVAEAMSEVVAGAVTEAGRLDAEITAATCDAHAPALAEAEAA